VSKGLVFWGSADSTLYAIDKSTGTLKWKFRAEDIIHATPEIDGDTLYVGDFKGNLFALNINDGKQIWSFKTVGDRYFPNGEIQKGVAVDKSAVYFGSRDYNVYALDKKSGRALWNLKEGSWVISTPAIHNKTIFYGTSDTHEFVCSDKFTGEVKWRIPLPMRVYGSAVIYDNWVFFGCFDGVLRGADISTGEVVFKYSTKGSSENYSNVYGTDGKFKSGFELYGRDYIEAERLIHTLGSILSTPVITDNTIYFGSSDGGVYAVKIPTK
jgi:outer membrane protein assembly factor BamB